MREGKEAKVERATFREGCQTLQLPLPEESRNSYGTDFNPGHTQSWQRASLRKSVKRRAPRRAMAMLATTYPQVS